METMEIGVCHKLELRTEGTKLYAEGPLVVYGDKAALGAGRTEVFMAALSTMPRPYSVAWRICRCMP